MNSYGFIVVMLCNRTEEFIVFADDATTARIVLIEHIKTKQPLDIYVTTIDKLYNPYILKQSDYEYIQIPIKKYNKLADAINLAIKFSDMAIDESGLQYKHTVRNIMDCLNDAKDILGIDNSDNM